MTVYSELVGTLQTRGWERWLSDMRGFPANKPDTLADRITRFGARTATLIGDGESDAQATHLNDAHFLRADAGWPVRLQPSASK